MTNYADFDAFVEEWIEVNPDLTPPVGQLFAQWLANVTGSPVIGRPIGGPPDVVAIPDYEGSRDGS